MDYPRHDVPAAEYQGGVKPPRLHPAPLRSDVAAGRVGICSENNAELASQARAPICPRSLSNSLKIRWRRERDSKCYAVLIIRNLKKTMVVRFADFSTPMMDAMEKILPQIGVPPELIHTERFEMV